MLSDAQLGVNVLRVLGLKRRELERAHDLIFMGGVHWQVTLLALYNTIFHLPLVMQE